MATNPMNEPGDIVYYDVINPYEDTLSGRNQFTIQLSNPKTGYALIGAVVLTTPNANWIFGYATVLTDTSIRLEYKNEYNDHLLGYYTLLLIYKKS